LFEIFNGFRHLWLIICLSWGRNKLFCGCFGILLGGFCSYNLSWCLFLKYRIEFSLYICKPKLLFHFRVFKLFFLLFLFLNFFLLFICLMQILKKLYIFSLIITFVFFHIEFLFCYIRVWFGILINNIFRWLFGFMSIWVIRIQITFRFISFTVCHVVLWCCLWVFISGCISRRALDSWQMIDIMITFMSSKLHRRTGYGTDWFCSKSIWTEFFPFWRLLSLWLMLHFIYPIQILCISGFTLSIFGCLL